MILSGMPSSMSVGSTSVVCNAATAPGSYLYGASTAIAGCRSFGANGGGGSVLVKVGRYA
jgi:hypothetical protein